MTVPSPKTEHHQGRAYRVVPIFPELRPFLDEAFHRAEPGQTRLISRWSSQEENLRTQMHRIIRRAGFEPWPRVFHNMRASRQTELEDRFPSHVVCAWMGNSQRVAREHYLQVTDRHFEQALEVVEKAVQNPVRQSHVEGRNVSQRRRGAKGKILAIPGEATECDAVRALKYTRRDSNPRPAV